VFGAGRGEAEFGGEFAEERLAAVLLDQFERPAVSRVLLEASGGDLAVAESRGGKGRGLVIRAGTAGRARR
jgi:hypothetical protein